MARGRRAGRRWRCPSGAERSAEYARRVFGDTFARRRSRPDPPGRQCTHARRCSALPPPRGTGGCGRRRRGCWRVNSSGRAWRSGRPGSGASRSAGKRAATDSPLPFREDRGDRQLWSSCFASARSASPHRPGVLPTVTIILSLYKYHNNIKYRVKAVSTRTPAAGAGGARRKAGRNVGGGPRACSWSRSGWCWKGPLGRIRGD